MSHLIPLPITGPLGFWQYPLLNAIIGQQQQQAFTTQKIPAEQVGVIIQPGVVQVEQAIRAQQEQGRIITRRPGTIGGFLIEEFNRRFTPAFERITRTSPAQAAEEARQIAEEPGRPPIMSQKVTIS